MKVEEVMGDGATHVNLKDMCSARVLPQKQEEKVQVCETNLVGRIVRVKRLDKRRPGDLRVEVGVKEHVQMKLARSSLTWAGHAKRVGDDKLGMRADAQKVEEKRGERGPKMRWGTAYERPRKIRRKWRKGATDRKNSRLLKENVDGKVR